MVGALVEALVGALVGAWVGAWVGALVGALVEALVGALVEALVGALVEAWDKGLVGALPKGLVGALVEAWVGALVGAWVGALVGAWVGALVKPLGFTLESVVVWAGLCVALPCWFLFWALLEVDTSEHLGFFARGSSVQVGATLGATFEMLASQGLELQGWESCLGFRFKGLVFDMSPNENS